MKFSVESFKEAKYNGEKIAMMTAYDFSFAKLFDGCGIDSILVGDSLGMVNLGYNDTLPVTVDDIIYHTRAVKRGVKNAFLIGDMPFMSYHISLENALKNAGRIIQEGQAQAVKLEGGKDICDKVKAIVGAQIPVMGHIGLTPQSINVMGGYKVQGRTEDAARKLIEDAKALEEAGAFAIVMECVPYKLAKLITESIGIPTIGIGSGKYCDGQVLVYHDMFNINLEDKKKFVKIYRDLGSSMSDGVREYIDEVRNNEFPSKENSFNINEKIIEKLK